ncbi:MAG: hypothetical protein J6Z30_06345, partial [Pyramidobacter sp.]|nr:hypothetical protein [Pyramidobacter sp.]
CRRNNFHLKLLVEIVSHNFSPNYRCQSSATVTPLNGVFGRAKRATPAAGWGSVKTAQRSYPNSYSTTQIAFFIVR